MEASSANPGFDGVIGNSAVFQAKITEEVAAPDPKSLEQATVLLIRHATTDFNVEHQKVVKEFGLESEEFRKLKANRDFVDPGINDLGKAQCESGSHHINKIDFKVVFTSPMRRTIETTIELFKNHPNKAYIKFVICPIFKESAHLCNDFMKGPFKEQIYDRFSDPEKCEGIKFDFQYIYGVYGCESTMQFNLIADLETMQVPYSFLKTEQAEDKVGTMNWAIDTVLEQVYEQFPLRIELYGPAFLRAQSTKMFMKAYFSNLQNKGLLQSKEHKVGIISHGMYVRCLSAEGYDPQTKKLVNAADMKNCEIYPCVNYKF